MFKINLESSQEQSLQVKYTAVFVDTQEVVNIFAPKHENVFAHHCTIKYKPDNGTEDIEVGSQQYIKIIGRASDEKGDVLLVENKKSKNKFPHITLSCAPEVKPFYSNELLEKAHQNNTITMFENPVIIQGVEGYVTHDGEEAKEEK